MGFHVLLLGCGSKANLGTRDSRFSCPPVWNVSWMNLLGKVQIGIGPGRQNSQASPQASTHIQGWHEEAARDTGASDGHIGGSDESSKAKEKHLQPHTEQGAERSKARHHLEMKGGQRRGNNTNDNQKAVMFFATGMSVWGQNSKHCETHMFTNVHPLSLSGPFPHKIQNKNRMATSPNGHFCCTAWRTVLLGYSGFRVDGTGTPRCLRQIEIHINHLTW